MTTMLIIGLSLIVLILFFLVIRNSLSLRDVKNRIREKDNAIELLQNSEIALRAESAELKNKLQQSFEDPTTHTLSWQVFADRLQQKIKESERHQFIMGILLVDIDEFRVINDALGYQVAELILAELAKRLETCIRQVDSLARFNKDTFAILLSQLGKPEGAAVVAQRILQTLKEPFEIDGHEVMVTVGMGIAIYPTDGQEGGTLLNNAVEALRIAKTTGKNIYQFYQQQMHIQSQRDFALHASLNRETIFNELNVYYQPIFNVEKESIFCMDALLHWQHPHLGIIGSQELTAYAAQQRKSNVITEWLLRNACQQFLQWRSLGFFPDSLGISISIAQLMNTHFIYHISQILQELQFSPQWLLLEIKESVIALNQDALKKAFNMLHYIGIKLAIDQFGAEGTALKDLKKIPVQYLKLTAELVEDLSADPPSEGLLKAIIFLAQTLSMEVICTGVESSEQMQLLRSMGCVLMQGQLLGAPLSPKEVEDQMVTSG